MVAFLDRVFGRSRASAPIAADRLRKVLVQDRSKLSPTQMEAMRTNLAQVLSQYMEIDEKNSQISIQSSDRNVSLVANIPIRKMKRKIG